MKQVTLDSLYLENFKTFVNPTWIALSKTAGLKFLSGLNLIEPRLGSNGAGKSTIWDALCWCLYGTGVRGQKAAELASWGVTKPHVMVGLQIDDTLHSIERWGSPNRLLINKFNVTQEDVDLLVGLSRNRFLQSVLFGQGVPLFVDLPVPARGELLDGVLDLGLWVELSEAAGRQAASLSQQVADLTQQISFERGRLAGVEDEANMQRLSDRWWATKDAELLDHMNLIRSIKQTIAELAKEIEAIIAMQEALPDFELLDLTIEKHENALRRVTAIDKSIEFYRDTEVCPTCLQRVSVEHRHAGVATLKEQKGGADADEYRQELMSLHAEKQQGIQHKTELTERLFERDFEITHQKKYLKLLTDRAEKLDAEPNPYETRLKELRTIKAETEARVAELEAAQLTTKGKFGVAEYWRTGFKKVRLFQVKQVLLRMEVETANAANALGIGDWKIQFVTETETKSGTTKPGIQVQVNDGSWEGFSGGEFQRIRLAVSLGLASMIQGMAGVKFNFEILDEPSHYLSLEGIEDLLGCLQARAEMNGKSIFVCDHSALSFAGFNEILCCVKDHSGSRLEVLTQSN